MKFRFRLASGLAMVASVLAGCGGGGGGQTTGNVFKLSIPSEFPIGSMHGVSGNVALGSVSGSSLALGGLVTKSAYWPNPRQCVLIPNLDTTTQNQFLTSVSPDGDLLTGTSMDLSSSSGGPARGFVYDRKAGTFHVLKLGDVYPSAYVSPNSIDASGAVRGIIYGQDSGHPPKEFVYDLKADTYTLSDGPDLSRPVTAPDGGSLAQISAYSQNLRWAVGTYRSNSNSMAAIWNVATGEGTAIGIEGQVSQGLWVSNDGMTATYLAQPGQWVWRKGKGAESILKMIQDAGLGSDWTGVTLTAVSDDGAFLATSGASRDNYYGISYPVLIKLK